jgi:diphthamide biosynthesis protein 2
MASELSAAPVLSTPAEYILENPTPTTATTDVPKRSGDELFHTYEIARTAAEIAAKGWRRVALQFPDAMLRDAGWVVGALEKELEKLPRVANGNNTNETTPSNTDLEMDMTGKSASTKATGVVDNKAGDSIPRLYVLADTSYSACCVDEIAAEHAHADAVVHYGRSCLSPTGRLPVLYVFTRQVLDFGPVLEAFEKEFAGQKDEKVVVMADVMFQEHVQPFCEHLRENGWTNVRATEMVGEPSALIPNRRVLPLDGESFSPDAPQEGAESLALNDYHLFHISTPPTALLLTLSSRLASLRIYSTPSSPYTTAVGSGLDPSSAPALLRRRYGLVIRLATASVIGILVNTLSVQNYLSTITRLREQIAAAGKKSYTIVVGKLNTAKLANFAEIDGWVVVGCWESGLVELDGGLWKPVVTPFEIDMALIGDDKRIWDGRWWGGIEGVVGKDDAKEDGAEASADADQEGTTTEEVEGGVDDEESEVPEFDLRTGKLISNSRPMRLAMREGKPSADTNGDTASDSASASKSQNLPSSALVQRKMGGQLAMVNGVVSPGAEYLQTQRTWTGLGSDFRDVNDEERENEESTVVEEGLSGVARGYTVGEDGGRT